MKALNKPGNLDDMTFLTRLKNGYHFHVLYSFKREDKQFCLHYSISRDQEKAGTKYNLLNTYTLIIEEGIPEHNPPDEFFDSYTREERKQFNSADEALEFLKEKEKVNIKDFSAYRTLRPDKVYKN